MPRYRYQCEECDTFVDAFHSYKELLSDCEQCDTKGSLKKVLSVPYYGIKTLSKEAQKKIGEITKEYIEENRKILEQQKEDIKRKRKDYDKT